MSDAHVGTRSRIGYSVEVRGSGSGVSTGGLQSNGQGFQGKAMEAKNEKKPSGEIPLT